VKEAASLARDVVYLEIPSRSGVMARGKYDDSEVSDEAWRSANVRDVHIVFRGAVLS
jgi:hypothetical protein